MQDHSPKLKRLSVAKLTADYIEGSVGKGAEYESKTLRLRNDQWKLVIAALRALDAETMQLRTNPVPLSPRT